jgi:uncharacterized damage-inducible protein DinB
MTEPSGRVDPPFNGDERTQLLNWLDFHRATVHVKCAGLTDEQARRAPLPASPSMSPIGLVSHLYWVERNWFERIFAGNEVAMPWLTRPDEDAEFEVAPGETLAGMLTRYADQCEVSRRSIEGHSLDEPGRHPVVEVDIPLRWILMHMIEETARHNGHLDAMRELIDGVRGE